MCNQCSAATDKTVHNRTKQPLYGTRIKGRNGRHDVIIRRADRSFVVNVPNQPLARQIAQALDQVA